MFTIAWRILTVQDDEPHLQALYKDPIPGSTFVLKNIFYIFVFRFYKV
jgi:hypothetical protein